MTTRAPMHGAGPVVVSRFEDLVDRLRAAGTDRRRVVGVAGSPGSGKSTLVAALQRELTTRPPAGAGPGWVAHVPMDGFHLADVELTRLGRSDRKGAPDTFDAAGYAALLARLRTGGADVGGEDVVYAPAFERHVEQPVAGSIPVLPQCRLVLTEGNYLLLDDTRWQRVRALMDEVWFVDADDDERRRRLLARHLRHGKSERAASAWVDAVDEPNARRVAASRCRADVVVSAVAVPLQDR